MVMRNIFYSIIFFILSAYTSQKLIGVIQFIRHGARAPLCYYQDVIEKYYPFKEGELTNIGFAMALEKGNRMRDYYSKNEFYKDLVSNADNIQVFSTPFERTIYTSLSYLKGLFPDFTVRYNGLNDNVLNNLLNDKGDRLQNVDSFLKDSGKEYNVEKKIINVEVFNKKKRFLYHHKCVVYDMTKTKKMEEAVKLDKDEKSLIESLKPKYPKMFEEFCNKNTNSTLTDTKICPNELYISSKFIKSIGSTLESINFHNLDRINSEILKLAYINDFRYNYKSYNNYMNRQASSSLFRYIKAFTQNIDNCHNKIKQSSFNNISFDNSEEDFVFTEMQLYCKKYALISAHDDILQNIIRNMFDYDKDLDNLMTSSKNKTFTELEEKLKFYWPAYLSDFSIEVHQTDEDKYIRLFFNGIELNDKALPFRKSEFEIIKPKYTKDGIKLNSFLVYIESRIDKNTEYKNPCDKI